MTENYLEELPKDIFNEVCNFANPKLNVKIDVFNGVIKFMFDITTLHFSINVVTEFMYCRDNIFKNEHGNELNINDNMLINHDDCYINIPSIAFHNALLDIANKRYDYDVFDMLYINKQGYVKGRDIRKIMYVWEYSKDSIKNLRGDEWVRVDAEWVRFDDKSAEELEKFYINKQPVCLAWKASNGDRITLAVEYCEKIYINNNLHHYRRKFYKE